MQELEWCSDNADHGNTTYRRDAIDIRSSLLAVSRAKPKRAAKAISIILSDKRNEAFKQEMLNVLSPYNANRSLETLMIKGIRDSIAHHTLQRGGSRTLASETFIQNVCCACMFGDDSEKPFPGLQVRNILGINYRQLKIARTKDKKGVNAKAVEFLLAENKWKIELDGGKTMMISYDQFCRGKKRLDKINEQKKKKDAQTK